MNRFREQDENNDFGPKMPHLPHFEDNKKYLQKYKIVTLIHFSMPVIRYIFRKI